MTPNPDAASTGRNRQRQRTTAALVALVVVTASLIAGATWMTMEASEERQAATAAADLRYASLLLDTVHEVEPTTVLGPDGSLDQAMQQIATDRSTALHALSGDERARANELLDQLLDCGTAIVEALDSGTEDLPEMPDHDHAELMALLTTAVERSQSDAATAERQSLLTIAMAVVGLGALSLALVRSRYDAVAGRSLANTWAMASRRIDRLVNDTPDAFIIIDAAGVITYRSEAACHLLGDAASRDDVIDLCAANQRRALSVHLTQTDVAGSTAEFHMIGIGDSHRWYEIRVSDRSDETSIGGHVLTIRDITAEVGHRQDLQRQAHTDVLTALPNRRSLDGHLARAQRQVAPDKPVAFAVLDLDGFKTVNDSLGHQAGDVLLSNVAQRLRRATPTDHVLLRLGGDEFGLIMTNLESEGAAREIVEQLVSDLHEPFALGARQERMHTSVGLATTKDPDRVPDLLTRADMAMYEAKRDGGDRVVVFEDGMEEHAAASTRVVWALRNADYDTEFRMVYQPIVASDDTHVVSYEALLRWTSPSLGDVSPAEFIPLAETAGEICAIGRWVLDSVCRQIAAWELAGLPEHVRVSVNFSARQLAEPDFVAGVLNTLEAWNVAPQRLVVEVTESSVLDHSGPAIERLAALRAAGIRISIDDFGAGYSNLGQLLAVPFDIIKIDRSLLLTLSEMREMAGGDPEDPCAIMQAIVSIAEVMQAPVVCEGVEEPQQLVSLKESGISYIQGYLTGRPMEAGDVLEHAAATLVSP